MPAATLHLVQTAQGLQQLVGPQGPRPDGAARADDLRQRHAREALLVVLGFRAPSSLRQLYLAWMALAFALGLVVSSALLTSFFFLILTPIAWVARLCGKDFLSLRLDPQAKSYWLLRARARGRPLADYEQQF